MVCVQSQSGWMRGQKSNFSNIFRMPTVKIHSQNTKNGGGGFYRDMLTVNNFSKTTYSKQVKKQKLTWSKLDASTMWKMVWEYQSAVGYIQM